MCREVWGAACRDIGAIVQDRAVPILLVVDEGGRLVVAAPQDPSDRGALQASLTKAMQRPGAGSPRRPQRLICEGEVLARQARAALKGTGITVEVTARIPALDEVFRSLSESMGMRDTLGVVDPARLSALGRRLYALAPWEYLWDNASLHFVRGGGLDGFRAVFLGKLGVSRAMLLVPNAETLERFRSGSRAGLETLQVDAVQLDPPDDMSDAQLREAHRQNLILPGGEVLLLTSMQEGTLRIALPAAQERLLVALEAAVGLFETNNVRKLPFNSRVHHNHTHNGETIHLHLEIPADPSALVDFSHQIMAGYARPEEGGVPILVIKAAKKDAEQLAANLAGLEAALVEGRKLWAIRDGYRIGWLGELSRETLAGWRHYQQVRVVVSAGGAKRESLYAKNLLSQQTVPLMIT